VAPLVALFAAACDRGTATYSYVDAPPVRVLQTIPENGAKDVPLGQSIRVQFDRFLAPNVGVRQSICISNAGPVAVEAGIQCNAFSEATYDPVQRVAVWKPESQSAAQTTPMLPNTRYTVQIVAPKSATELGIRAFDGAPLAETYTFSFTTGDETVPSAEPKRDANYCYEAPEGCAVGLTICRPTSSRTLTTLSPQRVLSSCAADGTNCHVPNDAPRLATTPVGFTLDLGGNQTIHDIIGRVATQTASGPVPESPSNGASGGFPRNMPYIDAGNPANSYLLYKMIVGISDGDVPNLQPAFASDVYDCKDFPDAADKDDAGKCADAAVPVPSTPKLRSSGDPLSPAVGPVDPDRHITPARCRRGRSAARAAARRQHALRRGQGGR